MMVSLLLNLKTETASDCASEHFKSSADRVFAVDMEGSLTELQHQRSSIHDLIEISPAPEALPENIEKDL